LHIPVVDLFAGPGGLNEGFSSVGEEQQKPVFSTIASFEMDSAACDTLRLRSAFRFVTRNKLDLRPYYEFLRGELSLDGLRASRDFSRAFDEAEGHVHQIELGPETRELSSNIIRQALADNGVRDSDSPWVLIGGPPCQAYSLAGRARRTNDARFEEDKKHFLYREYLQIIAEFAPPVFVMENVKGLLSSKNAGDGMFARILGDLRSPAHGLEYEIHSLVIHKETDEYHPNDFVIESERFGIPQKRHRVILLGLRKDIAFPIHSIELLKEADEVTVSDAISGMPRLRSGLSRERADEAKKWQAIRETASNQFPRTLGENPTNSEQLTRGGSFIRCESSVARADTRLSKWIIDENIGGVIQHETRAHMRDDLLRYWFAAVSSEVSGTSPKLRDFPKALLPNHANAESALRPFEDRFRVQVGSKPSTTVVSHIAKDGHYYIHPDPNQMRSMTVREVARLQTFPDNYFFCGHRTNQFTQVGNAVPPLLANQIGEIVSKLFVERR